MPSGSTASIFLVVAMLFTSASHSTWAAETAKTNRDAPLADVSAGTKLPFFRLAIAEPLRHDRLEEVAVDIARYRSKGYNAVFFENDIVEKEHEHALLELR